MTRIGWLVPGGVADEGSPMHIPALSSFARMLAEKTELIVFSFSPEPVLRTEKFGAATILYLPAKWNDPIWKRAYCMAKAVIREHRRNRFDAIHGFWALPCGFLAVAIGRLLGIRTICSFLGGETAMIRELRYGNMRTWSSRAITLWVARRSDTLHLLTQFQRMGLSPYQADQRHWNVFPLGVDTSLFRPSRKSPSRPIRILHVANITEIKDQETLLRSFQIIAAAVPAHLRIVGPDFLGGTLQRLVREWGLSGLVEFTGYVSQRHIAQHYRWARYYLQTSLHEGQGIAVLEAMASGVVVCGTAVGILSDLSPTCGIAVPVQEPRVLADTLLELARDRKKCLRILKEARTWTVSHDFKWTAERFLTLYRAAR